MADNVTIPASGTGTATPVIATDDVSSVHYQKIKIALGADGAIDTLLDSGQQLAANSAPVVLASDHPDIKITLDGEGVTNAGTFAVQESGAALTALQLIDNLVLAEDAAHGSGDPGVQALAVRKDSGAAIAGADGDYSPLQVDASGNLRVNVAAGGAGDGAILDGASSSIKATVLDYTNSNPLAVRLSDTNGDYVGAGAGTQYTEDAAAAANPVGNALIMVRDDSRAGSITNSDGDNIAARGNNKGEQYVKDTDAAALLTTIDDDTGNIRTNLTTLSAASHAEDTGHISGEYGIVSLAVRRDTPTAGVSADGDYATLSVNGSGKLYVLDETVQGAIAELLNALSSYGNDSLWVGGDIGHGDPDGNNPVKVGSVAFNFDGTAPGTASAENDRVNQVADVYGRQYVETTHPNYWSVSNDYASAQTNTSLKGAPGAGLKLYITDVIISNGATAGNITLLDGSGGTVKLELYPGVNGGLAHPFRTPIALTANTALCLTSTTVTTHSVTICGFTAP